MPSAKLNLFFNFLAKISLAAISFFTIPVYLKILGPELFGLIGIFTILSNFIGLLDLGLSSALNREMARLSALPTEPQEFKNLTRTLETVFWITAIFIGVAVLGLSGIIAEHWIHTQNLSIGTVKDSLIMMGISLALLWPSSLYSNALMGLQKQVANNIMTIVFGILRNGGSVFILYFISPTLYAFFLWQIAVNLLQTIAMMIYLWKSLPFSMLKPKFDWAYLRKIRDYATGLAFLSVVTLAFVNIDKIVLSKILDLKAFGYYMLAANLAMNLYMVISPIYATFFPKITQAVSVNDMDGLKNVYHKGCQVMSVLLMPATLALVVFIDDVLFILTRDLYTVQQTAPLARLLLLGTACNGLMNIPFALQLAHGWLKYSIWQNIVSAVVLIPLTIVNAKLFGSKGAALTWLIHNAGCVIFMIPLIHGKFLPTERKTWYLQDIAYPLLASMGTIFLIQFFYPTQTSIPQKFISLAITYGLTCLAACLCTPMIRDFIRNKFSLIVKKLALQVRDPS